MPLVFVHGVATRIGAGSAAGAKARDALFRRFLLSRHRREDGAEISVTSPHWGRFGATLHWNGASLPVEEYEQLGAGGDPAMVELYAGAQPPTEPDSADAVVLEVARRSLRDAVDLLWSAAALAELDRSDEAAALAALGERAYAYAVANDEPAWLAEVSDDQQLITRLQREVEAAPAATPAAAATATEYESLGVGEGWNALRRGVARMAGAVTSFIGKEVGERLRPAITPGVANFLGDVFVYLHEQERVDQIGTVVGNAIRDAARERTAADPLVVVAHSMGGNITYDLLTSSLRDVEVDLFVTAGSQVAFFEELKLFRNSDKSLPGDDPTRRVPRPTNVRRWINVFDQSDVLAFEAGSVFDGVEDFAYRTGALLKAHTAYFVQPGFHERLAKRAAG